jgi:hypothetical protein
MNTTEWRWSTGEEYLKSPRKVYQNQNQNQNENLDEIPNIPEEAIQQSLNGYHPQITTFDSFGFDITFSRSENASGTRREDLDNKISDRQLIVQRGTNPFLQTNDYVDHVVNSDLFLKPKNTTTDRVNTKNNESNEQSYE